MGVALLSPLGFQSLTKSVLVLYLSDDVEKCIYIVLIIQQKETIEKIKQNCYNATPCLWACILMS